MTTARRLTLTAVAALAAWAGVLVDSASAGCGCEKPPPVPAAIRPRVTYPGTPVTIFSSKLTAGKTYSAVFTSGTSTTSATVSAVAVSRRDTADGVVKVQLSVTVPTLPLGPTQITVKSGSTQLVSITDADFTVAPAPVAVPAAKGTSVLTGYRAAVSRSGVVYVSLDLSQVQDPLVVRAQLRRYPLRFDGTAALFYNIQGYLMQSLGTAMPGLFTLSDSHDPADSDVLQYSRHEFNSYFLQHAERQPHALDASDANWHVDGTRHIDHNHLILALPGTLSNGALPSPGTTSASDLVLQTYSLFSRGLIAVGGVTLGNGAYTKSYDSRTLATGHSGDVLAGGLLTMDAATIDGAATAAAFKLASSAVITGGTVLSSAAVDTMPVQVPKGLVNLGQFTVNNGASYELVGPASYLAARMDVQGGSHLSIDNSNGPITLYVSGPVSIGNGSTVTVADPDPEKFAIYVVGPGPVNLTGMSTFNGVVYAPQSPIAINNAGVFYGSFIGSSVDVQGSGGVAYDVALRGSSGASPSSTATPTRTSTPPPPPTRTPTRTATRTVTRTPTR